MKCEENSEGAEKNKIKTRRRRKKKTEGKISPVDIF